MTVQTVKNPFHPPQPSDKCIFCKRMGVQFSMYNNDIEQDNQKLENVLCELLRPEIVPFLVQTKFDDLSICLPCCNVVNSIVYFRRVLMSLFFSRPLESCFTCNLPPSCNNFFDNVLSMLRNNLTNLDSMTVDSPLLTEVHYTEVEETNVGYLVDEDQEVEYYTNSAKRPQPDLPSDLPEPPTIDRRLIPSKSLNNLSYYTDYDKGDISRSKTPAYPEKRGRGRPRTVNLEVDGSKTPYSYYRANNRSARKTPRHLYLDRERSSSLSPPRSKSIAGNMFFDGNCKFGCESYFNTETELQKHYFWEHICDICQNTYKRRRYLTEHKHKKHPVKPVCSICGMELHFPSEVDLHSTAKHEIPCNFCTMKFIKYANLTEHTSKEHNNARSQILITWDIPKPSIRNLNQANGSVHVARNNNTSETNINRDQNLHNSVGKLPLRINTDREKTDLTTKMTLEEVGSDEQTVKKDNKRAESETDRKANKSSNIETVRNKDNKRTEIETVETVIKDTGISQESRLESRTNNLTDNKGEIDIKKQRKRLSRSKSVQPKSSVEEIDKQVSVTQPTVSYGISTRSKSRCSLRTNAEIVVAPAKETVKVHESVTKTTEIPEVSKQLPPVTQVEKSNTFEAEIDNQTVEDTNTLQSDAVIVSTEPILDALDNDKTDSHTNILDLDDPKDSIPSGGSKNTNKDNIEDPDLIVSSEESTKTNKHNLVDSEVGVSSEERCKPNMEILEDHQVTVFSEESNTANKDVSENANVRILPEEANTTKKDNLKELPPKEGAAKKDNLKELPPKEGTAKKDNLKELPPKERTAKNDNLKESKEDNPKKVKPPLDVNDNGSTKLDFKSARSRVRRKRKARSKSRENEASHQIEELPSSVIAADYVAEPKRPRISRKDDNSPVVQEKIEETASKMVPLEPITKTYPKSIMRTRSQRNKHVSSNEAKPNKEIVRQIDTAVNQILNTTDIVVEEVDNIEEIRMSNKLEDIIETTSSKTSEVLEIDKELGKDVRKRGRPKKSAAMKNVVQLPNKLLLVDQKLKQDVRVQVVNLELQLVDDKYEEKKSEIVEETSADAEEISNIDNIGELTVWKSSQIVQKKIKAEKKKKKKSSKVAQDSSKSKKNIKSSKVVPGALDKDSIKLIIFGENPSTIAREISESIEHLSSKMETTATTVQTISDCLELDLPKTDKASKTIEDVSESLEDLSSKVIADADLENNTEEANVRTTEEVTVEINNSEPETISRESEEVERHEIETDSTLKPEMNEKVIVEKICDDLTEITVNGVPIEHEKNNLTMDLPQNEASLEEGGLELGSDFVVIHEEEVEDTAGVEREGGVVEEVSAAEVLVETVGTPPPDEEAVIEQVPYHFSAILEVPEPEPHLKPPDNLDISIENVVNSTDFATKQSYEHIISTQQLHQRRLLIRNNQKERRNRRPTTFDDFTGNIPSTLSSPSLEINTTVKPDKKAEKPSVSISYANANTVVSQSVIPTRDVYDFPETDISPVPEGIEMRDDLPEVQLLGNKRPSKLMIAPILAKKKKRVNSQPRKNNPNEPLPFDKAIAHASQQHRKK